MPSFALPNADLLDILTISDSSDPPPAWAREWAESVQVHAHVDVGLRRASRRNLWAMRLDETVRRAEQPVIIVAYGVSCFALAWWARLSPAPYFEHVAGALLVRPLGASVSSPARGLRDYAGPKTQFPFSSIVVGDGDGDDRARVLSHSWGSDFVGFDGFDRQEDGLGAHALRIGTGLIERLAAASAPGADAHRPEPRASSDVLAGQPDARPQWVPQGA
jgi:predicted alpha/beta hydrolase family esterase